MKSSQGTDFDLEYAYDIYLKSNGTVEIIELVPFRTLGGFLGCITGIWREHWSRHVDMSLSVGSKLLFSDCGTSVILS